MWPSPWFCVHGVLSCISSGRDLMSCLMIRSFMVLLLIISLVLIFCVRISSFTFGYSLVHSFAASFRLSVLYHSDRAREETGSKMRPNCTFCCMQIDAEQSSAQIKEALSTHCRALAW